MSLSVAASTAPAATAPAPTEAYVPTANDPGSALLALILQSRGVQGAAARGDVNHAYDTLEDARRQIREALARAAEAEEHSGFWGSLGDFLGGDIATIAEVVTATAVVLATGGTGAVAVLAVAAAGLSVGAGVGERLGLDPKLCALLAAGGAVVGALGGNLSGAAGLWADVAQGGRIAQATATAGDGGAHAVAGEYQADALDARADAERARAAQSDALFRFDHALDTLRRAAHDIGRAESAASDLVQSAADGRTALIQRIGAA